MKGLFVACEGLDCAGKTTTIQNTIELLKEYDADKYNVNYSKGLKTNSIYGRISSIIPCSFTLLLELSYINRRIVEPCLHEGHIVLQDRWIYSILSHNTQKGHIDRISEKIFSNSLREPDIYVHFTCSLEERLKRLSKCLDREDHEVLYHNPELINAREKRFLEHFNTFGGDKYIIDTTHIDEQEAATRLYQIIKNQLALPRCH